MMFILLLNVFLQIIITFAEFTIDAKNIHKTIPNAKNVQNIPVTPIVETQTIYNSILKCKTNSKFENIYENVETVGNKTCNGFTFSNEQYLYYAVVSNQTEHLKINEFTVVSGILNGNIIFITCGYIVEGQCSGDYLFSVQIYMADDQNGCQGPGVSSQKAVYYTLSVYGKCGTTCSLESATAKLNPPLTNTPYKTKLP